MAAPSVTLEGVFAIVLALVLCLVLALAVVVSVALPARRGGREVLAPRGEKLVDALSGRGSEQ